MSNKDIANQKGRPGFNWVSFIFGVVVGGIAVFITLALFIGISVYSALYSFENLAPTHEELDARVEVSVGTDGCTLVRSEVEGSSLMSNLTWVVIDTSGEQVLGRNAMGEYEYTYYRPGEYYVHLEASHEGEYVPISNEVIINCP